MVVEENKHVRQSDPTSPLFFILVLDRAIEKTKVDLNGTIINESIQDQGNVDDIIITGRSLKAEKKTFSDLNSKALAVSLEVNEQKTKVRLKKKKRSSSIFVFKKYQFERVF